MQNFRCFESLRIEIPKCGGLFVGLNAQGKTSILEAVCVLMRLHSPRAKMMRPMVRFESTGFGLAGESVDHSLQVRHGRGLAQHMIDGVEQATQHAYLQHGGLVVWMGNEDVELVRGSGEARRHYLDFLCAQLDPVYRRALARYRRALKARNFLLKSTQIREQELSAYAEIMIEYGDYLSQVRERVVTLLESFAAEAQLAISGCDEVLEMRYLSGSPHGLRTALAESAESERRQRHTIAGPHRDEVKFILNGMPAADFASEGQQRTLALSLKLAQGRALRELAGRSPVYLLDDIFGELDPGRRNALLHCLPEDAQKLITTTTLDWLEGDWSDWACYEVANGEVRVRILQPQVSPPESISTGTITKLPDSK